MTRTLTSQDLSRHPGRAKKAAENGPVTITHRGRPTHVLLAFEEYERLARNRPNIVDLLAMRESAEIEFEAPRLEGPELRAVELS